MKPRYILFSFLGCSVLVLAPFLILFQGRIPENSLHWGAFGDYMSGASSLLNVIVFILITIMIHDIDSKSKRNEMLFNQRKEVFARFLSAFEDMVINFYTLKAYLAKSAFSTDKIGTVPLYDSYAKIKALRIYAKTYILDDKSASNEYTQIISKLDNFLDSELFPLIMNVSQEKYDQEIVIRSIEKTKTCIEDVIDSISGFTRKFIGGQSHEQRVQ